MSEVGEAIRNHHRELVQALTAQVSAISEGRADADPEALARFLREELLPHAIGEERHLYPAVDPLVKAHGSATATMSVDHEHIEGYIREIGQTVDALATATPDERTKLQRRLREIVLRLDAVLRVHLEKEERVYLPLFEQYLSVEEQRRVLDGMHEAYEVDEHASGAERVVDVRHVSPAQRHPLIFQTFEDLAEGESFILVNDHDPRPLYYQFQAERPGQFTWEYLEQGPEVWRVRIGRT